MQCVAALVGAVQLEYPLGQIDAQNVDFHDEPPFPQMVKDAQFPAKVASGPSQ
jgi:hypothetical protein